jgi:hypothetical protein
MTIKLLDADGNEIAQTDLQNKHWWCQHGEKLEQAFVRQYPQLGFRINPEKATNRYAPDLVDSSGMRFDLKTQNTPFFQAQSRFRLDPQTTVTFNRKDRRRYSDSYPDIGIIFWVDWVARKGIFGKPGPKQSTICVHQMRGVWQIEFAKLYNYCYEKKLHRYQGRIDDKVNARDSYLISLLWKQFTQIANY